MAISAAALDFHKRAGAELLAAGAIVTDGFEAVAVSQADHDDVVVRLDWSSELGGYTYFSPTAGPVRVDDNSLSRFTLNRSWFFQWIGRLLGFGSSAQPMCLIRDRAWDLGDTWLGETKRARSRTAVYFARQLAEPETIMRLATVLRLHASRPSKVVLTTTNELNLVRAIIGDFCAVLAIETCAHAGIEDFEFDAGIVYSAAHRLRASPSNSAVHADVDFRLVRVGDREFRFRGDKQRQVVGFLYRRWENGKAEVGTALMFEELQFATSSRLRDLFKGHPNWKDLIGQKDGACWLRCGELPAEPDDRAR